MTGPARLPRDSTPRPGDYGVTPGSGWPMLAVRMWTGHPPFLRPAWAGHAAIVSRVVGPYPGYGPDVWVIEATPDHGVRERQLRDDELARWRFSRCPLTGDQRDRIVAGARTVLGRPYDWPSVVEVGIRVLVARFKGRAAEHPDQRLFCSELVAWTWRDFGGVDLFPEIAPGTVEPERLRLHPAAGPDS